MDPLDRVWDVDSRPPASSTLLAMAPASSTTFFSSATSEAQGLAKQNGVPPFVLAKDRSTDDDGVPLTYMFQGASSAFRVPEDSDALVSPGALPAASHPQPG